MTYHLHTEDRANLGDLTSQFFPEGFTILHTIGYWHGTPEHTAVIEIVTDCYRDVLSLASLIRTENRQEAVMVERMATTAELVTADHVRPLSAGCAPLSLPLGEHSAYPRADYPTVPGSGSHLND